MKCPSIHSLISDSMQGMLASMSRLSASRDP